VRGLGNAEKGSKDEPEALLVLVVDLDLQQKGFEDCYSREIWNL
jgi:hypothetical protein